MKRKKKSIILVVICVIILIFYFTFVKGIYASSNKIVGPYSDAELYKEFLNYDCWQIGENIYGEPIFCYQDNAFQFIKTRYADIIDELYENNRDQYKLSKLNKNNINIYKDLINELSLDIDNEQCNKYISLMNLLSIYENGQKRWKYTINNGWNRVY